MSNQRGGGNREKTYKKIAKTKYAKRIKTRKKKKKNKESKSKELLLYLPAFLLSINIF